MGFFLFLESELVSGFMTEHAAVVFVFFFLAEYGSIVLMCILTSLLFLGGYLILDIIYLLSYLDFIIWEFFIIDWILVLDYLIEDIMNTPALEGLVYGFSLGLKSSLMIFTFVWARASFPRIRFDQLMSFCWTVLLPIVFAFIILVPCILYSFDIFPINISLFSTLPLVFKVNKDSINKDAAFFNKVSIEGDEQLVSLPVYKLYTNIHLNSTISLIIRELCSSYNQGVYGFVHNNSGKIYIGSSRDLANRITSDLDDRDSNKYLQFAFRTYGKENFTLCIFEVLSEDKLSDSTHIDRHKDGLVKLKELYLDLFLYKYHINVVAGSIDPWIAFGLLILFLVFIIHILDFLIPIFYGSDILLNNTLFGGLPLLVTNKDSFQTKFRNMSDSEFNQWFSGFVDAEGCFSIESSGETGVRFRFFINLHVDDREVLDFIQSKLKCGNIKINNNYVRYSLNSIKELNSSLIPLLENFPLNGVKYLDFLAFREGINIKLSNSLGASSTEKLKLIFDLKNSMNSSRDNYEMPSNHTIRITPYWLLGLIEGEGSFFCSYGENSRLVFNLYLTSAQEPLMLAIKNYLESYWIDIALKAHPQFSNIKSTFVYLYYKEKSTEKAKPSIELKFTDITFIVTKFIPLLSNLSFVSKKYYDFLDWWVIGSLIWKGKHTTEIGQELIKIISKGMNNYRLSTSKFQDSGNKAPFTLEPSLIDKALKLEDVYTVDRDGLRRIVSTGELVKGQNLYILAKGSSGDILLFKDMKSCGEWFNISSHIIKSALDREQTISGPNNLDYKLFRKSLLNKEEGINPGITNSPSNVLISSILPLENLHYIFVGFLFWGFLLFFQLAPCVLHSFDVIPY